MLCYQSSRGSAEIIHDTFAWLRLNHRAIQMMLLPILAISAFVMLFNQVDTDYIISQHFMLENILEQLAPLSYELNLYSRSNFALSYFILAFVTTFMYVPIVRQYFVYRKGLQFITIKRWPELLRKSVVPTVVASAIMAFFFYYCAYLSWFAVAILWIGAMLLVPVVIMRCAKGVNHRGKYLLIAKISLIAYLIFCVVKAMPSLLFDLLYLMLDLLALIMPQMENYQSVVDSVLSFALNLALGVSTCLAIIVWLTISLFLHGTIFSNQSST